jgi:hypothetical protein
MRYPADPPTIEEIVAVMRVIQRQLGHTNLGITSIYLQGIGNAEIIDTVHSRRAPWPPSTARCESDPNATGREERRPATG